MQVLVINSGSSSLKVKLVELIDPGHEAARDRARTVCASMVEGIGQTATLTLSEGREILRTERVAMENHEEAVRHCLQQLERFLNGRGQDLSRTEAVGHRVVHGGERFQSAVELDRRVLAEIEALSELAPLHNPKCLAGIRGSQEVLGRAIPMVAVFDTAFHRTLPSCASSYAIPSHLSEKYGIRRYGFHGIAHASMTAAYARRAGRALKETRIVTLHLGSGCSAAAVSGGRSVDTSMGFTPLEGLVMGTRSGDLDPSLASFLARREGVGTEEVERWLNERSGLLGVSGVSGDMREILSIAERDPGSSAARALELFCYRARKYVGAYLAALGGAEAVVFGGGIGERAPTVRAHICRGLECFGLQLDRARNRKIADPPAGEAERISSKNSRLAAYVVAVDEETEIAWETRLCLQNARGERGGRHGRGSF